MPIKPEYSNTKIIHNIFKYCGTRLIFLKRRILQTTKVSGWNKPTAMSVLRVSMSSEYIDLIHKCKVLVKILLVIFSARYPRAKHLKYQNKLYMIHQDNFKTIKASNQESTKLANKLVICLQ